MNTQEICGILETVNPEIRGFGKQSENTTFLVSIGYVITYHENKSQDDGTNYWCGQLTDKGIRYLKQNKPESEYFKIHGH